MLTFNDGSKHEDVMKVSRQLITHKSYLDFQMVVFSAHSVVLPADKAGWLFLWILRAFAAVDMYLSFEAHTEETIDAGRRALRKFALLFAVRSQEDLQPLIHPFFLPRSTLAYL